MTQQISEPVEFLRSDGTTAIRLDNQSADATFGGGGSDGDIHLLDGSERDAIHLNGNAAKLRVGTAGNEGDLAVQDAEGRDVFIVSGHYATCYLGSEGNEGDLFVRDSEGRNILTVNGHLAQVTMGAGGNPAQLRLVDDGGRFAITFDTRYAALYVGAEGNEGDIIVRDGGGRQVFHVDGGSSNLRLGASGNGGDIEVFDDGGRRVFYFRSQYAALYLGSEGNEGDIRITNDAGVETIRLDGQSGDIELVGADCAEEFDVVDADRALQGAVMVIGDDGRLRPCTESYDRRVAGVISGAGGYSAGVTLDKRRGAAGRRPVALMGKVFTQVDATYGPIAVGDILTTSQTPGHAMRATDPARAFGAVLGKALRPLPEGRGLLPTLVALQ